MSGVTPDHRVDARERALGPVRAGHPGYSIAVTSCLLRQNFPKASPVPTPLHCYGLISGKAIKAEIARDAETVRYQITIAKDGRGEAVKVDANGKTVPSN